MIPAAYFQILQKIIVQNTVIDPLACRPFAVDLFVFFRIPGDAGMETQVAMVFYVDGASIASRGTCFFIGTGIYAPAFQWAAVLVGVL